MSFAASRALLRRPQVARFAIRNASTTSEAANAASSGAAKAKESASQATSKASEGLTKVTSSAGSGLSRASEAATSFLGRIGGRTGRVINFAQSLVPPTLYYGRVGLELGKLVAQGRKMTPPDVATFQSYFQSLTQSVRSPSKIASQASNTVGSNPTSMLDSVRNMDNQQLINIGVVTAEIIGFFTVGEMLGRLKIIGYRSSGGHGEHH